MIETLIYSMTRGVDQKAIENAATLLVEGKTVAFPTETVYGLGANALNVSAVKKIYIAKGRPSDNPLIIHLADRSWVDLLVSEVKPYALDLMETFWPGPLTLVMKKSQKVSDVLTGGLETVALRMPSHPIARALIESSGIPIAAPSANLSGKPSPTEGKYVIEDLRGRVDGIIDGGAVDVGLESTVLDVTGDCPVILRPGSISKEDIEAVVGFCDVDPGIVSDFITPKSPGMKYKHYAPNATVFLYEGQPMDVFKVMEEKILQNIQLNKKTAILLVEEDALVLQQILKHYNLKEDKLLWFNQGSFKDLRVFGRCFFRDLRCADAEACDEILIRGVPESGIGYAIMNRLRKAAGSNVFKI